MNVLCSFLTIYALLCSNVVVHLSDHNPVMVAQVDYHNTLLDDFFCVEQIDPPASKKVCKRPLEKD